MIDKQFFQLRFLEQHSAAQPFAEGGEQGNGMVSDVNQSLSFQIPQQGQGVFSCHSLVMQKVNKPPQIQESRLQIHDEQ